MYCPKCGKEIDDGSVFCNYCGQSISSSDFSNLKGSIPPVVKKTVLIIGTIFFPGLGHLLTGKFKKAIIFASLAGIPLLLAAFMEENLIIDNSSITFVKAMANFIILPVLIAYIWGLIDAFKTNFK